MNDAKRSVTIEAYRDADHTQLVHSSPVIDLGISGSDRVAVRKTDEQLIASAKSRLRGSLGEEVDTLHFVVVDNKA